MLRPIKFLVLSIISLAVVLLLSSIVFMNVVNPDKFKPQLRQYIQTATGRELDTNGNISWTFLPRFGLKVTGLQLNNPPGFTAQPFAQIKQAEVKLAILPLLKKHLVAEQLVLQGLQLNLIKDKSGINNWQMTKHTKADGPTTAAPALAAPLALHVAKLKLSDAEINFWDHQQDKQLNITHLNLTSQNLSFAKDFPIHLSFNSDYRQEATRAEVDLKAIVNVDPQRQSFNLRDLVLQVDVLGSGLPNGKLNVLLKTNIQSDSQVLSFKPFTLTLDKQVDLTGEMTKNFNTQVLNFHFTIPQLTFPASSTTPSSAAAHSEEQNASAGSQAAVLPLALLRSLNAQGDVRISKLLAGKFQLSDLVLNLAAKQGIVQLAPVQAKLYSGDYQGQITVDARGQTPIISCSHSLQNVELGQLLNDITEQHRFPLAGKTNLNLQLTTIGNDKSTWVQNLGGRASFVVQQGVIKNIDVEYELQKIQSFLRKQPQPKAATNPHTTFDKLSGSFQIAHGMASNVDLSLQAPTLLVKGQGMIDLAKQTLDYKLQAKATSQNIGSDVYRIQDYLGGSLPIVIAGPWEQPTVNPDWNSISQAIAKSLLNKQTKGFISEHIDKNLSKDNAAKLKHTLQNLFG